MDKPVALVIDDEPDIRELLALTLGRMDVETIVAEDIGSGKKHLSGRQFDLCLTDMRLPDGDGLELVEWMQKHAAGVPVAVITAHGNVETAVQALKLGAFDFISKPLDLQNLRNIVENALKLGESRKRAQAQRKEFGFSFPAAGQFAGHAGAAPTDRSRSPKPGTHPHFRRVRNRKGTRRPADS
jgi:two-component system response regulator PilR (NtrC family)